MIHKLLQGPHCLHITIGLPAPDRFVIQGNDNPGPLPPHLRYPPSFRVPGAPDDMPVVLGVEVLGGAK